MALPITPALPPAAPPQAAQAAPGTPASAAEQDDEGGFARVLQGETTRAEQPADEAAPADETKALAAPADDPAGAAAPLDPALAHWLAGLHLPAAPEARLPPGPTTPSATTGASAEDGSETLAAIGGAPGKPGGPRGLAERGAAEPRTGAPREPAAPAAAFAAAAESRDGASPLAAACREPAARAGTLELPAALNVGTPAPAPATPAVAAPAPVDVALAMGPTDNGFGEAFATQVSVLARDGVQQAELHLNPAETGPVSVQIVLEGTQARIEFGADALPTRQAIEGSLPELAAALREEGLTLSGGGVSEHARGRHEPPAEPGEGGSARRGAAAGDAAPAAARSVRMARSAGGLDLYA